nr:hypothetical protein [uncultured Rhodoferax sp.]
MRHSLATAGFVADVKPSANSSRLFVPHGGPRSGDQASEPGTGNCLAPASTSTVRKCPTLQTGHKPTSILLTRAIKA